MADQWIVVPNWDRFQHYSDRDPPWIKLYTSLNSNPEWLGMTYSDRGLLATIWVEYARSHAQLTVQSVRNLGRMRDSSRALKALSDAGFIRLVASKPSRARARKRKRQKEETEDARAKGKSSYAQAKEWVQTVGWRFTDSDLHEALGAQFGLEHAARTRLAEIAGRIQADAHQ